MPRRVKNTLNFIDIFSGAGGLSCGLEMAGLQCLLGVDIDKNASETFKHNHRRANVYCGDIKKLDISTIKELTGNQTIHAVVGGPPCQGFSTVGTGNPKDKRNNLFRQFLRIVKETNPTFIIIENVTGLLASKNQKTLSSIFNEFIKLGFNLDAKVLSSEKFGVPEKRRRTIIIGTRVNANPVFPRETHDIKKGKNYIAPITVGEAFKSLKAKNGEIYNHDLKFAKLSNSLDERRLKKIPEGKGIRYQKDELEFLTPSLRLNVNWDELKENRFRQTKFQRLDRQKTSPTIMTHRHSYFHPTENRYLTQREAASCQSFPNNFIFYGPITSQWRQIGNAVPPLLGKALGKALIKMFKEAGTVLPIKKRPNKKEIEAIIETRRKDAFIYKKESSL